MFIIRFLFYSFIFYVIMKLIRLFVDPMFNTQKVNSTPNLSPKPNPKTEIKKEPSLGEYVEYEEIK